MRINPSRPLERLRGTNSGIVALRLGRTHIGQSTHTLLRVARPLNMRKVPVALRRGWVLCALETIAEYRETYDYVRRGM